MPRNIDRVKNRRGVSTFLPYLHREDRAPVITRYFTHLKHLAIATLPDNFAQLEVLRSCLLSSSVDILFRYGDRLDTFRSIRIGGKRS